MNRRTRRGCVGRRRIGSINMRRRMGNKRVIGWRGNIITA